MPFQLDLMLPYLLFAFGLTLYPPFEPPHAAFPVPELGYCDDLDSDVRHHVLERRVFGILPGRPLRLALITFDDGKSKRIGFASGRVTALADTPPRHLRPIEGEKDCSLVDGDGDFPGFVPLTSGFPPHRTTARNSALSSRGRRCSNGVSKTGFSQEKV